MNWEREDYIAAAELAGGALVLGGLTYGGYRLLQDVVTPWMLDIEQTHPVYCLGCISGVVLLVLAGLASAKSNSDSPPRKVDLSGFSGGHVAHSVSVAPFVDEDTTSSDNNESDNESN